RGLDDLERNRLAHLFDFGSSELPSDQPLHRVQRIRRVGHGLPLRDLPDKSFVLVRKRDDGRRCAAAFLVRDNLHGAVLKHRYTAVCCAEVDSDYFAHNALSSWWGWVEVVEASGVGTVGGSGSDSSPVGRCISPIATFTIEWRITRSPAMYPRRISSQIVFGGYWPLSSVATAS